MDFIAGKVLESKTKGITDEIFGKKEDPKQSEADKKKADSEHAKEKAKRVSCRSKFSYCHLNSFAGGRYRQASARAARATVC